MPNDERILGQLMAKTENLEKAVQDMNRKIDELMVVKERSHGIVTGIVFIAGAVGAALTYVINWLSGR